MSIQGVEGRLAVYGTLAPGRVNHHHIAELGGEWSEGSVRGRLLHAGWGAHLGFPGIVLDGDAEPVPVQVFHSAELPMHWDRLDTFEGPAYQRVVAEVDTGEGSLSAYIYELREVSA